MEDLKKNANDYAKALAKNVKEWYGVKSPFQLDKAKRKEFFKRMDKAWTSKKESSVNDYSVLAKKVNEYFTFVQDQLKQNYPKDNYKSPLEIKDKAEQKNFFSQVKRLWKTKKAEEKTAGTVQVEFFKKFDKDQLDELASSLEIARAHGKIKNKVVHTQLLKALNKSLDSGSSEVEEES